MRLPVNQALPLAALVLLGGCLAGCGGGGDGPRSQPGPVAASGPAADYPVVVGEPYTVDGVTYTPSDKLNYDAVGHASAGSEGGGHVSIAHKTLPVPSYAEVTALDSGKTILVRVERRGPMNNDRIVELSPGAAEQLGLSGSDKAPIRIRRVNPPEAERAMLRSGNQAPSRMDTPQSLLAVLRRKLDPAAALPAAIPAPSASGLPPVAPPPVPASSAARQPSVTASPRPVPAAVPAARPQAVTAPAPAPTPAPAASSAVPARGQFVVQIGAFAVAENARRAAAKTGGQSVETGRLWRVRMGPFASREQAVAALSRAKAAGFPEARIESAR